MNRSRWAQTPLQCVFLTREEYHEREEARRAAVAAWPGYDQLQGKWPDDLVDLSDSFLPPGSMWEAPWHFDPTDPADQALLPQRRAAAEADPRGDRHLSVHYWRDWADKRPPLVVVCPDRRHWVVDSKSSNGTGWTVTGQPPAITCAPSIWTSMSEPGAYHGFLRAGVFSPPV